MERSSRPRVSLVTGAAAGIGRAVVDRFVAAGDQVIALDRDQTALAALSEELPGIATYAVDVADPDEVQRVGDEVSRVYGSIGALVCAAGIQRYGTVEETDTRLFNEVIAVNLGGVFATCRTMMPLLRENGGSIVVVSSIQAYASQTGVAAYTATKGGLLALVRAMALDHAADGIRVNAVCPGSVDTPMLRWAADQFRDPEQSTEDVVAQWGRSHPLGRVAKPGEVADAIAYLAGPTASFVTGADLEVDGGVMAALGVALPETDAGQK